MNNKGFTLIELLAVIVILTSVSLVAVAGISASLGKRDKKECEEQKELAINAAKIYFSLNPGNGVSRSVDIITLKSEGFLNELSKINRLDCSSYVKMSNNTLEFKGECVDSHDECLS